MAIYMHKNIQVYVCMHICMGMYINILMEIQWLVSDSISLWSYSQCSINGKVLEVFAAVYGMVHRPEFLPHVIMSSLVISKTFCTLLF